MLVQSYALWPDMTVARNIAVSVEERWVQRD
jgi:ABC-type sugar transport system ATPase subunit